jgi:four helix bundle protein
MRVRFDHESLDVYRVGLEFVGWAGRLAVGLSGTHRHARDQLLRSAQSIPLNVAEGNGKRAGGERRRYFEIARGSAMECAATLDVLVALGARSDQEVSEGKELLLRMVAMLTKMAPPSISRVRETLSTYWEGDNERIDNDDYENENGDEKD